MAGKDFSGGWCRKRGGGGGGTLTSSSGIPIVSEPIEQDGAAAAVLLASYHPDRSAGPATIAWLRRLDRAGMLLGCVDTGALVFAKAGLLSARPAAAHPEAIAGFHQQFPRSLFVDRMHDFSPPRFSSAGGVATLDMTLALIAHFAGERLGRRVGEILTYAPRSEDRQISGAVPAPVRDAAASMQAHMVPPLAISEIAARVGEPVWRLNRLFLRHLHRSPTSYYVDMRLARARDMLRNTTLPIGDVASACGYENADAFSRAYRSRHGRAPSNDRTFDAVAASPQA